MNNLTVDYAVDDTHPASFLGSDLVLGFFMKTGLQHKNPCVCFTFQGKHFGVRKQQHPCSAFSDFGREM